jgi:hypothetical protein
VSRLLRDPDSANAFLTMTAAPRVRGDSAEVDVLNGLAWTSDGSAEMGVYRYLFVRDAGTWHFVRRTLMYAT